MVRFFERDMIGNFNGTISNMNQTNIVPSLMKTAIIVILSLLSE